MKILFNGQTIKYPLTGIGHFSNEIFHELQKKAHVLPFLLNPSSVLPQKQQKTKLSQLRALATHIPFARKAYILLKEWKLKKFLIDNPADVYLEPNFLLLNCSIPGIPFIYDISTLRMPHMHPKSRVKIQEKNLAQSIKKAKAIITISEFSKAEIVDYFKINPKNIFVSYCGASQHFKPRSAIETEKSLNQYHLKYRQFILVVGTFEPRKNLKRICEAYSKLPEQLRIQFPLVLCGASGWGNIGLNDEIKALIQNNQIQILNYISDEVLYDLTSSAKFSCYASLYEGFGLPVLEAMQSGTPIITSNTSSMPEVAGDAGILVNPLETMEIQQAMLNLLENDELCQLLSEKGLIQAKKFNWRQSAEVIYKTCEYILSQENQKA